MKKSLSLVATVLVGTATLTACGGGDGDSYCDDLESQFDKISETTEGAAADPQEGLDLLEKFADESPDEVKEDWGTLDAAISAFYKLYEDAGVDMDKVAQGEDPGVDQAKLAELAQQAAELPELDEAALTEAQENITKHAKDECDVDLNDTPSAE